MGEGKEGGEGREGGREGGGERKETRGHRITRTPYLGYGEQQKRQQKAK